MDPESIVNALRKNAVLVVMHVILGTVIGMALGLLTPDTYTSTASASVGVEQSSTTQSNASVQNYITSIMPSLVQVGTSESTLNQVSQTTGVSPDQLKGAVSVSTKTDTVIIEVGATHTDPAQAQAIAEAELSALDSAARKVFGSGQDGDLTLALTTLDSPTLPTEPSSLSTFWTSVIGGIGGLGIGTVMAALLYTLNRAPQRETTDDSLIVVERGSITGS